MRLIDAEKLETAGWTMSRIKPESPTTMVYETKKPTEFPSAQPDLQEYSVWFRIGETLVDVSKMHITAEEGIEKIRSYLQRMKKPERKTGKWIKGGEQPYFRKHFDIVVCSKCNKRGEHRWNYCPNCGADMSK